MPVNKTVLFRWSRKIYAKLDGKNYRPDASQKLPDYSALLLCMHYNAAIATGSHYDGWYWEALIG